MLFRTLIIIGFAVPALAATTFKPTSKRDGCDADFRGYQQTEGYCSRVTVINAAAERYPEDLGALSGTGLRLYNNLLASENDVSFIYTAIADGLKAPVAFKALSTVTSINRLLASGGEDCRCNLISCNNAIYDSNQLCQNQHDQTQQCEFAYAKCFDFYTDKAIAKLSGNGNQGGFCCNRGELSL